MKKCLILVNPNSGDGKNREVIPQLKERLEESFDDLEIIETKKPGEGRLLAQKACREGVHSLFVLGGDGSFNEVVNGIAREDHRPIIGLLPGGTNNTYYRLLGDSKDLSEAISAIDLDKTKEVDLGDCNGSYFAYYACFGRLIDATTSTKGEEKEKLGPLAYVKNIFKALPEDDNYEVKVTGDGGSYQGPASHVYAFLVDQMGDIDFSELSSSLSSGELYVYILTDEKTSSKISAAKDLLMGKLDKNEAVESFSSSQLKIEEVQGKAPSVDLDGEMGPKLPVNIKVLPNHMTIYLPKEN